MSTKAKPGACPVCGKPLTEHIEQKPCVQGKVSTARNLWDLPIFGRMWAEDARDVER